jgi:hypothetical protein
MCPWRDHVLLRLGRERRSDAAELILAASIQLKHADIDEGLLIDLNDSGYTFDEIAEYLDRVEK